MKAMTCPQCGAVIKSISRRDEFALCDFCGAKILIEEITDRRIEISDKAIAENRPKLDEKARRYDQFDNYPEENSKHFPAIGVILIIGIAGILTLVFAINSKSCQSRPSNVKEQTPLKGVNAPQFKFPTPTTTPQINYEVKAQWSGNNDIEHFESPQIDMSKLSTSDPKELKKTVFKNRAVQVKITINTAGEVTSGEAISGHPILTEAAVEAAKKSLFNSRSKPTTRVLTYYFRLIDS